MSIESSQCVAPVVQRLRKIRFDLQCSIKTAYCLLVTPKPLQRAAAVVQGLGEMWIDRECSVAAGKRLLVTVEFSQPKTQIGQRFGRGWVQTHRPRQEVHSFRKIPILELNPTQNVKGVELVGHFREDLPTSRLGFLELTPEIETDSKLQGSLQPE